MNKTIMARKANVRKAAVRKPAARKVKVAQVLPRLSLWSDANFQGRRLRFRGNLGVRSLVVFNYNDVLSSFDFTGRSASTLVLFENVNYQGERRVFRGSTEVAFLNNFNDRASSFIISRGRLTNAQIDRIQNRRSAPDNFAEVLENGTVARK